MSIARPGRERIPTADEINRWADDLTPRADAMERRALFPTVPQDAHSVSELQDADIGSSELPSENPAYSSRAREFIAKRMRDFHHGRMKSSSGHVVRDPKQAAAIALSEARSKGMKVPRERRGGR